ncbi:MAG: alpha-xylosidase [Clostridia bacterium]|jgi:alpha-D-xyloside xylohydrolase|nr:alpha-xylosidase [Clostridia bacterium]
MKFTEGYWCLREDVVHHYVAQAYDVEAIPGGLRVYAPCRLILDRGNTLNQPMLTIEFTVPAKNIIAVRAFHHSGFIKKEPAFEKNLNPQSVTTTITDDEALMTSGSVAVRINRKTWGYSFEGDGKPLTSSGFHNLGFMEVNRENSSMSPGSSYLRDIKKPYMLDELLLDVGECVYGLGERFSAFVKNGQQLDTWNEDGGTSSLVAYKCIPFYMTNRGYGVFVDHTDNVSFEVASEKVSNVSIAVPGEELRYHIIYGPTPREIISNYTSFTGRPALPPAWSFGLWLSTSFTTNYDETTVSSFIDGMFERNIPFHVFHFDCFWMREFNWCDFTWDERIFPDPKGMLKRYKEKGLKIDVWINPYIAQRSPLFAEASAKGYLVKRADGRGIRQLDMWQAGMGLVDFTNPDAYRWYQDKLKTLIDMGVDCFKTDFGERIPVDVIWFDGSDPNGMHNYYTFLYNRCVHELLMGEKGEAVLFARSATAGSQQFPVHWGGDCSASYQSMAETMRGGLSFAMSGFAFWSHDISGFEQTATPDVYKRWCAYGLLSTHSRLHGSTSYRVPWLFDDEACDVLRHFTELKCTLMPYIYHMSVIARDEGLPVMRPMIFEFPDSPAADYLDRQYMLGESLLTAPIFNAEGISDYYLPEGKWTHLLTNEVREGGRWYRDTYDYFSLPLYVKPNTLLAIGSNKTKPDYDYADHAELHLYELSDGSSAHCVIPDLDGNTLLTASAHRTNEIIHLSLSDLAYNSTFILHNINEVKHITGGSFQSTSSGVTILPHALNIKIQLC